MTKDEVTYHNCRKCRNLFRDGEGWELPQFDYWYCRATSYGNLKSFPFDKTKCSKFEPIKMIGEVVG